jgi:hypothetical protein
LISAAYYQLAESTMESITTQSKNPDPFCCDLSLETDEVMAGTAPTVKCWFLLEYSHSWNHKATEENDLPSAVWIWLDTQLALAASSRLIFIKQHRPAGATGLAFFVALSHETGSHLYHFHLDDYEGLLKLDLSDLLSGDPGPHPNLQEGGVILVCTNGKRDRCCAREGPAVYQVLAKIAGDRAWQCTHLGGHRFAPTLLTLPDGAFYGRLTPAEAGPFVRSYEQGELFLEKLRGRAIYDPESQAAEQFLRRQTGLRQRNAYRWQETATLGEDRWAVTFWGPDGQHERIAVVQEAPVERLVSCHPLKIKTVARYRTAWLRATDFRD